MRITGVITKSEAGTTGKVKSAINVIRRKPVNPNITIRQDDGLKFTLSLHQRNRFEIGNTVTVFAPEGYAYEDAEDHIVLSGYYLLCKDLQESVDNEQTQ